MKYIILSVLLLLLIIGSQIFGGSTAPHSQGLEGFLQTHTKVDAPDRDVMYEASEPDKFDVELFDAGLAVPSRMLFLPNTEIMLIAQLDGVIWKYEKQNDGWYKQNDPLFTIDSLVANGERGLSGVFTGAEFDLYSKDKTKRDLFLTYQTYEEPLFKNKIMRITLTPQDGKVVAGDIEMIYEPEYSSASAHQIQNGIGIMYEDKPHILVAIGDSFRAEEALDPQFENGKLIMLQRDGSDPLGIRPWPEYPRIQAIGIRNPYDMLMLPKELDSRQRIFGLENGDSEDRFWFIEAVDFDHEEDKQVSLGWDGNDSNTYPIYPFSWKNVVDLNAPGPIDSAAVLKVMRDFAPTVVQMHPGKGVINAPDEYAISLIIVSYGKTAFGPGEAGRGLYIGALLNYNGGQPRLDLYPLVHRKEEFKDVLSNPVAAAVNQIDGTIFFSDVIHGDVYEVTPLEVTE